MMSYHEYPVERPPQLCHEHLEYLDRLRESSVTNMFGAVPYLMEEFMLRESVASEILAYWMKTFSIRHMNSIEEDKGKEEKDREREEKLQRERDKREGFVPVPQMPRE